MAVDKSRVEIGYLEKSEGWRLDSRYFPSKVGGKPAWLDLKNISVDITCRNCSKPCIFLCQLYAPIEGDINAYRRSVYIFICRDPSCCKVNKTDNFKVFRCQLPQKNDFYVEEEPGDDPDWHPESHVDRFNSTCLVCGCLGPHHCSKCKSAKYCSREHQILDWKAGHKSSCGNDSKKQSYTNLLFPEFEILTEPEIIDDDDNEKVSEIKSEKTDEEKLKEFELLLKEGKAGTLKDIPVEMIEQYAMGKEDKYLKNFKKRLEICPDQVVRYDRGGQPLWIAEPNLSERDIPNCELCGGPRIFEFQVLPTLLTSLEVDSLGESIDWGTLLVYTCKNNCSEGPAYKKEFLWKQDVI